MKVTTLTQAGEQRRCLFCKRLFMPYPTVCTRQYACQLEKCQAIRQRLNELDWHHRHQTHDHKWYRGYYKKWRQKHPNYQKRYRLEKKQSITEAAKSRICQAKEKLKRLLKDFQAFQAERRKQLQEQEQQLLAAIRAQRKERAACAYG